MKNCRNPLRFAKFVFFTLLALSAIFFLKSALVFQDETTTSKEPEGSSPAAHYVSSTSSSQHLADAGLVAQKPKADKPKDLNLYTPEKFSDDYTRQMVRNDFHHCIAQPSKTFCDVPQKDKVFSGQASPSSGGDRNLSAVNFNASSGKSHKGNDGRNAHLHPVHSTLVAFTRLCMVLKIKPVLIEPSVVYCMLNEDSQTLLMKRRFNASSWIGGENVVTFALSESDSAKLSDPAAMTKLLLTDFRYWSVGMDETVDSPKLVPSDRRRPKTHHFFVRQRTVVHLVVFFQRNNYLWHGGIDMLPNEVLNFTPMENLLFSKDEAIYERFLPVPVPAEPVLEALYIPSDPRLFLHQIGSSQFLRCNTSNAVYANQTTHKNHGYMSQEKFVRMTNIAIQEMKLQLHPELMTFWIMGGTLLGWYRECGVIPYTTDVDFAAWAADVDDAETLAKKFINNKNLKMKEVMGLPKEALEYKFMCHGLKVDLFFCYDDGEHYWVSGHRPSKAYYFPYNYPKFTLCSAELLGQKVQVPCDTLEVLLADYGKEWVKPIENWNYEVSPKNMGKKHYWRDEEKPLVYVLYN